MIDGIDTKIQNVKDAFHRWSERRAMRKWDTPLEDALPAPAPLLPRRRQWQAFGFAAGVFVAALAAPGVGRVTRQEVGLSLFTGRVQTIKSLWTGAAVPMQAQRQSLNPALANDVEVQVAKVMFAPDQDAPDGDVGAAYSSGREAALQKRMLAQTLPALRVVMARFPADPLPRAAFLTRVCTFGSVNVIIDPWRDDTHVTPATPTPPAPIATPAGSASGTETKTAFKPETDMGSLKQCVQVAEEGERLEPDNAYFPVVLAHLHFAARDDQAALADIDRASRKPRWEDYDSALIRGACRLHDAQLGVSGSILHQTARDTALFLYGGFLYETARHLLLLAWKQEHAGNWEAGFALRGRMMRVGATIRDQARGRFVSGPGENMFLFACNFPRIEKGKYVPATISPQQVADYPQYLRHHHHAAEADWVQSQLKYFAATDVGALYQDNPASYDARSLPGYDEYDPGIMIRRVIWFWGAGVFALAQITLLLLTGGAGGVAELPPSVQPESPASPFPPGRLGNGTGPGDDRLYPDRSDAWDGTGTLLGNGRPARLEPAVPDAACRGTDARGARHRFVGSPDVRCRLRADRNGLGSIGWRAVEDRGITGREQSLPDSHPDSQREQSARRSGRNVHHDPLRSGSSRAVRSGGGGSQPDAARSSKLGRVAGGEPQLCCPLSAFC